VIIQFSQPFIEAAILFPLFILGDFFEDELTINVCAHVHSFYSVPLLYMSVFMPLLCYLSTIALQYILESGSVMPLAFFLTQNCSDFWYFLPSTNFVLCCSSCAVNLGCLSL
jgi:hypothetical protein